MKRLQKRNQLPTGKHFIVTKERAGWLKWLIPFALIAPAMKIGEYGVGTIDLLIVFLGIAGAVSGRKLSLGGSPIVPYIALFLVGWIMAALNGPRFGVNFQSGDLVIFYRLGFCFLAWQIGYWSLTSMERVATSRFAIAMVGITVCVAILFSISSVDQRLKLIGFFQPISRPIIVACSIGRFPGINEFVNIYSFLPLCMLVFSFRSYMIGHSGILIPAFTAVLIVALGSRTTMLSAGLVIIVIFFFPRANSLDPAGIVRGANTRLRNRLLTGLAVFIVGLFVAVLLSRELISGRGFEKMAAEESIEAADYRFNKWEQGMKRVAMAPVLGIPEPKGSERETLNYYLRLTRPHNEFVQIWMWYGLLGLAAHVYLLVVLLRQNIQYRTGAVWCLFYIAVIIRMFLVSNFKSYHFSAVFFMIAGYNWKLIEMKARAMVGARIKRRGAKQLSRIE